MKPILYGGILLSLLGAPTGGRSPSASGDDEIKPSGAPVAGLVLSVPPVLSAALEKLHECMIPVTLENTTASEQPVVDDYPRNTYRVLVYDSSGAQVPIAPSSYQARCDRQSSSASLPTWASRVRRGSLRGTRIAGGASRHVRIRLSDFVVLQSPGTYRLVILRKLFDQERQMLSSNLIELTLTE